MQRRFGLGSLIWGGIAGLQPSIITSQANSDIRIGTPDQRIFAGSFDSSLHRTTTDYYSHDQSNAPNCFS